MKIITTLLKTKPILIIFLFAFFLRLTNLDSFPVGFHSDEARVGWNAISIAQTGHDDWGNFLPLYYNTFGDYRPAGIIYATIPSILFFGRTEFAVRFPSALFGALAVFPIATLATKITTKKNTKIAGVFAAILWSITPWSFSTSRATSEVVISLTLVLFALAIFTKEIQHTIPNRKQLLLGFFLIVLSTFFYHTARILVPLYWIMFAIYFRKEITTHRLTKTVAIGAVALLVLTGIFSLGQASRGRLAQVSIMNPPVLSAQTTSLPKTNILMTFFSTLRVFTIQYTTYLSPEFLIGDVARPLRYTTAQNGLISVAVLVLFLIGVSLVIKKKITSLPFVLLLISPFPAALTIEDVPNLHRAFFMLPFLIILAAHGLYSLKNKSVLFIPIIVVTIVSFIGFIISYFGQQSSQLATFRSGNAKEVALYLNEVSTNYDKVFVTNDPDSLFPWYAFFGNKTPFEFNAYAIKRTQGNWNYQNIIFTVSRCPSAAALDKNSSELGNILIIDGYKCERKPVEKDHPETKVLKEFFYPNGEVVYRIWERGEVVNRKK